MARTPIIQVPEAELVIGLVAPVGTGLGRVYDILEDRLKQFGYSTKPIKLSDHIKRVKGLDTPLLEAPEAERLRSYMDAGDEIRRKSNRGDYLALSAVSEIAQGRARDETTTYPLPRPKQAYVLQSLKHPDEVLALREVYASGFFLLGVNAPKDVRLNYLKYDKGIDHATAEDLINRDEHGEGDHGQQTREAFELADAFVALNQRDYKKQVWRILDLLFGHPYLTPTRDEYAMFLAYAASLRSADLSRQVGAVIRSQEGEIIATGANDVPAFGGGLYWPNEFQPDEEAEPQPADGRDQRDYVIGYDSNARRRNTMIVNVARRGRSEELIAEEDLWAKDADGALLREGKKTLEGIGVTDITEYSRAVHAEMEALLAAGRNGTSPRGGTLYCTTFPCHNCAKHIVAAGIQRVVYVEPYPKSQAIHLHNDSIDLVSPGGGQEKKVRFEPFVGVGPRRFLDLFSLSLSTGRTITRNDGGRAVEFDRAKATLRAPVLPMPYLLREQQAVGLLSSSKESTIMEE